MNEMTEQSSPDSFSGSHAHLQVGRNRATKPTTRIDARHGRSEAKIRDLQPGITSDSELWLIANDRAGTRLRIGYL